MDWRAFLTEWMRALGSTDALPAGASETMIAEAEARLGVRLPPSFRAFLAATNGLRQPREYIATTGGDFWPVAQLEWFRVRNAEWIAAYADMIDHIDRTLELTHDGDSAVYLLNPMVVGDDGEWEAWEFANWIPGERRYPSFEALMRERRAEVDRGSNEGF